MAKRKKVAKPKTAKRSTVKSAKRARARSATALTRTEKSKPEASAVRAKNAAKTSTELRRSEEIRAKISDQVEKDRAERIANYRKTIATRPARAEGAFIAEATAEWRILAEGDSWFDFPTVLGTGGGVINHIERQLDVSILNLAHAGDEARDMMGVSQRTRLRNNLGDSKMKFNALLFSGGGNDLIGDAFCLWLKPRSQNVTPENALEGARVDAVLQVVRSAYDDLIALRDDVAPACHIFTHAYDIPQPGDQGVCGYGPWLKPSLVYRGWTDPVEQRRIAATLLGKFDTMLAGIEARQRAANRPFTYVRTQNTLTAGVDWHDEIHPNRQGFGKIAGKFAQALNNA